MKAEREGEVLYPMSPGANKETDPAVHSVTELQQETWRKDWKADRKQFVQGGKLEGEE